MSVTSSIWGAPDTWVTPSGKYGKIGKVANFNGQGTNFLTAIQQNILAMGTKISDKSLSWCGMGTESNYSHIKIFAN